MGRQLRIPLTMTFEIDAPIVYQAKSGSPVETGHFVMQAGHNTEVIAREAARPVLAHRDQIRLLPVKTEQPEDRESARNIHVDARNGGDMSSLRWIRATVLRRFQTRFMTRAPDEVVAATKGSLRTDSLFGGEGMWPRRLQQLR